MIFALSKLYYVAQVLPLPKKYRKQIDSSLIRFILRGRHLSSHRLTQPLPDGPNLLQTYPISQNQPTSMALDGPHGMVYDVVVWGGIYGTGWYGMVRDGTGWYVI
jgi:hypothetical protein